MARIRSIHPGLWTDEAFMALSAYARLMAIGIWNECDDQGAFSWKPTTLKVRILPADVADGQQLLEELIGVGMICRYMVGANEFGAVRNFRKFQRPEKPKAVHPMPPEIMEYVGLDCTTHTGSDKKAPPYGGEAPPSVGGSSVNGSGNSSSSHRQVADTGATTHGKSGQMEDGLGKKEEPPSLRSAPPKPTMPEIPDWMPLEAWNGFVAMRRASRKPFTPHAAELIVKKLAAFRDRGLDVAEALNQSTMSGWTGIFEPKNAAAARGNGWAEAQRGLDRMTDADIERNQNPGGYLI